MKRNTLESLKSRITEDENGCWLYPGEETKDGYIRLNFEGKKFLSHRFFYEQLIYPIKKGFESDHLCRNRACCNPEHVEIITHKENCKRAKNHQSQKTHCPSGHLYNKQNTAYTTKGRRRHCRQCMKIDAKKRYKKKMADPISRAIIAEKARKRYHKRKNKIC